MMENSDTSSKKKIHFFVRSLNEETGGGSHHNAISFVRFLRESGYEVYMHAFVSFDNRPPKDISLIEHPGGSFGFLGAQLYLEELLHVYESDADLFFLYGVDFTWGGGKYRAHGGQVPVVVYLDTYLGAMGIAEGQGWLYHLKRSLWDKVIGLRYAGYIDQFFAVSPFLQEQYIRFGFPRGSFSVVPNFFELSEHIRSFHADAGAAVRLLYAGRLIVDKGTDLLIRAVATIPSSRAWTLRIVGSGPLKVECERLANELGVATKITFIPWVDAHALAEEYAQADIFVHPARWPEPFGRTVIEAMEWGVPVIVPSKGGAAWIVGEAGARFENGSLESLSTTLNHLIEDTDLRLSLGVAGKERASVFSKEVAGGLLTTAVKKVMSSR